ncbi:MAG: signal recognition particle-docking protein FtsY, partial [Methanobacteriota archaeon]
MWNALKDKLQSIREKLGARIEEKEAEAPSVPEPAAAQPAAVPEATPPKEAPPAPDEAAPARAKPSFVEKVKVFVKERELIISEKELEGPLQELELVLLENDVALPATEAILAHVRDDLVGKHRRIRESSDAVVFEALKGALLSVLGNGLDLAEYIR